MKCKLNKEMECLGPEGCNILGCALDIYWSPSNEKQAEARFYRERDSINGEIYKKKLELIDHILTYGE